MAFKIPTTQESADRNLARLESALGQTAPLQDRAFLRVLAVMEALSETGLYKLGIERAKQNLALTATGDDLDRLGQEYATPRKLAVPTILEADLSALNDTIIPVTTQFTGSPNGITYNMQTSVVAAAGVAKLVLTAEVAGVSGNLQVSDELTIVSPVAGAEQVATVTAVTTTGADRETDAAYRPRVRFAMRATTGGGNATDHKVWAEEVPGVLRAYPYAGKPVGGGTSYPGDRTVYVECDSSLSADGIPSNDLLTEVRGYLNTDPVTGRSRPTLGLTDDTLYVEPIYRTAVGVEITGLTTLAGTEASVKDAIESALDNYFRAMVPYVEGVDLVQDRNDLFTDLTVSTAIQDILSANGASAEEVALTVGVTPVTSYQLSQGETVKSGTVTYA